MAWGVDPHIIVPSVCDCRLSLSSSDAVPVADQTAKTTVYCHPYKGNLIALFDGAHWRRYEFSTYKTASVPATTVTPFDLFLYYSGGLQLEAVSWTNDTTRATALVDQDGILVKSGATGRRYLGTARTTSSSGECEDSASKRFLWNYYNRRSTPLTMTVGTTSWTYTTETFRYFNGDSANIVELICGVAGEAIADLTAYANSVTSSAGTIRYCGIGQSSASNAANRTGRDSNQNGHYNSTAAKLAKMPAAGYHFFAPLEFSQAAGTTTWYGGEYSGLFGTWQS